MGTEYARRSRRSQNHNGKVAPTKFAYDPYSALQPFHVVTNGPASIHTQNREVAKKFLPKGTLRIDLFGAVPFIPFPENVLDRTRQRTEAPPLHDRPDSLVQLFFGQLPYKVADNMIVFLCEQLAESEVLYIERVMQDKNRKGCMQVFVDEDDVDYIVTALNKRVLFDATGVWHAQDEEQLRALERHCASETNRFKGFPFRVMVVEKSTSTYVRHHRQPAVAARRSRSCTPPPCDVQPDEVVHDSPPPQYEEAICTDNSNAANPPECCPCGCCSSYPPTAAEEGPYASYVAPPPYPVIQAEYGVSNWADEVGQDDEEDICSEEDVYAYIESLPTPPPYYSNYPLYGDCGDYTYTAPPPPPYLYY